MDVHSLMTTSLILTAYDVGIAADCDGCRMCGSMSDRDGARAHLFTGNC